MTETPNEIHVAETTRTDCSMIFREKKKSC